MPETTPFGQLPDIGTRIQTTADIERYPNFLAPAGLTGTVVASTLDLIAVAMDEPLAGAEEWDNQIQWYPSNEDEAEVIADFWASTAPLDCAPSSPAP